MAALREEEYMKQIEYAEEQLLKMHADSTDWKTTKTTKHVKVLSKKSPSFHGHMHRIECTVDVPMEKAFEYYVPSPMGKRAEWDKQLQLHDCIGTLPKESYLFHAITHSQLMGIIASREFVYVLKVLRQVEEGLIQAACISVDHPDYPHKQNPVWGTNFPCGTFFKALPNNQTNIVNYYNVDLGGNLPQSVLDNVVPGFMSTTMETFYKKTNSIKK